jgi:hypothetical protein
MLRIINLIYDYNLCGIFSCPKLTRIGIYITINSIKQMVLVFGYSVYYEPATEDSHALLKMTIK